MSHKASVARREVSISTEDNLSHPALMAILLFALVFGLGLPAILIFTPDGGKQTNPTPTSELPSEAIPISLSQE